LRRALEDSDNWETVTSKDKRSKQKATQPPTAQETTEKKQVEQTNFEDPPLQDPTPPGQKWDMELLNVKTGEVELREVQDSEWEVAY